MIRMKIESPGLSKKVLKFNRGSVRGEAVLEDFIPEKPTYGFKSK